MSSQPVIFQSALIVGRSRIRMASNPALAGRSNRATGVVLQFPKKDTTAEAPKVTPAGTQEIPRKPMQTSDSYVSQSCRDQRILDHMSLVRATATHVLSSLPVSVDLNDLVQDGTLGLISAAEKFDEGKGVDFSSYARHRIREIGRAHV
mgnify:FL=1